METAFYVSITGNKQGKFKGESAQARQKEKIAGLSLGYEVQTPRDLATGQASGKRLHKPVVLVKEWGAATPQIFQALVTNEVLTAVLFEFVRTNPNGEEQVYFTIRLTDAIISDVQYHTEATAAIGAQQRETVSLVFRQIEIEHVLSRTTAVDDWVSHP